MDNLNHLRDLLVFDVQHLYSVEEQIIEALPAMIGKASHPQLKQALEEHLLITRRQKDRLDQIKQILGDKKSTGIFSDLINPNSKSKGIEGLITEGEKVMAVDMEMEVMDAAIIGCTQKIKHYEISSYGTARTYAEQLGLIDVAQLLQQTLIEEHDLDDRLTALAVSSVNREAGAAASTITSDIPSNANM
jgi:ferritin-like metal-binding protein YciE